MWPPGLDWYAKWTLENNVSRGEVIKLTFPYNKLEKQQ